ncbi:MAG: sulfate transporter subunit [Rhodocyclales bacterium]|nr:sulfate transporter subunit [Rhodocyclales bacterium]
MRPLKFCRNLALLALGIGLLLASAEAATLTNVSYDTTREMYAEYNTAFAKYWKRQGGSLTFDQRHGNSGNQASLVNNGLEADVVSLALPYDIDLIAANGILSKNWQRRLPNESAPYTSTIVFLVRRGNPKRIKDWSDLVRWGVSVVIPNPKTSGAARWSYLAAWGYALKQPGGNEESARTFLRRVYGNTKVLEYGARGATNTFAKLKIGDVMVSWENEALRAVAENPQEYEIVVPSISVLAEPAVAVVDSVVDKHGTRKLAESYLQYLYSPEGQEIAAKYYYRPSDPAVLAKHTDEFRPLKLFRVEDLFGSWQTIHNMHFKDGGVFDSLYDQYRNAS